MRDLTIGQVQDIMGKFSACNRLGIGDAGVLTASFEGAVDDATRRELTKEMRSHGINQEDFLILENVPPVETEHLAKKLG